MSDNVCVWFILYVVLQEESGVKSQTGKKTETMLLIFILSCSLLL